MLKTLLKTYRGTYTQDHLDRISKGRCQMSRIIKALDKDIGFFHSTKMNRHLSMDDINLLVESYQSAELFDDGRDSAGPMRTHSPKLLSICSNSMSAMNGKALLNWLKERIEICRIRQYYRQFVQPHDSYHFGFSSSLEHIPDSANSSPKNSTIEWAESTTS